MSNYWRMKLPLRWAGAGPADSTRLSELPLPGHGAGRRGAARRACGISQHLTGRRLLEGGLCARASVTGQRETTKLEEGTFQLDIRKKSFPVRAARRWHRLPGEAMDAPSLAVPKARLDGAGGGVSLPLARVRLVIITVPADPNPSVVL